jgi:ABC-type multidrug transport system ATPase subunit/ABC-type multidrug transport system permease subunit
MSWLHFWSALRLFRAFTDDVLLASFDANACDLQVIGNPGSGKTTLLRAAAGLNLAGAHVGSGHAKLVVDGLSAAESEEASKWCRLAAMSTQFDNHFGLLTVSDTLQYAADWQQPSIGTVGTGLSAEQVADFIGLDRVMNTRLGTETVRGVSGGEARRVSVGEALVAPARVWLLDSFSDGLDAARTKSIASGLLRPFAEELGGTVVCVLQQPAQELYELFDDVILMRDGQCMYSGPRKSCSPFFEEQLGFVRGDISEPEFLAAVCSEPHAFEGEGRRNPAAPMSSVALTADDIAAASRAALAAKGDGGTAAAPAPTAALSSNGKSGRLEMGQARAIFSGSYARGCLFQAWSLASREVVNTLRDVQFLQSHFIRSIIMALVVGSLYSGLSVDDFVQRIALLFFTCLNLAMGGAAELPVALNNKLIVDRQARGLHMYMPWLYSICVSVVYIPIGALEVILYAAPTYYIVGFAPEGERFAVFFGIVLCLVLCMLSVFRLVAWSAGTLEVALAAMTPFIALFILFSGFLATRSNLGWGEVGQWLYWFSPVAWSIRALAVNEFLSSAFDDQISVPGQPGATQRKGTVYLDTYEIDPDPMWVDYGFAYVAGLGVLMMILGAAIFHFKTLHEPRGTRRRNEGVATRSASEEEEADAMPADEETGRPVAAAPVTVSPLAAASITIKDGAAIPATSAIRTAISGKAGKILAFRDLTFDVRLVGAAAKKAEAKTQRAKTADGAALDAGTTAGGHKRLLNRISGVARPGRVLALCGESGAGKTTLLNTLAGRTVTQGHVKGTMMLGGESVAPSQLRSRVGYVEQFDRHLATATVREALVFAAWMRRGHTATTAIVNTAVDEALELLELRPVENRTIGDEKAGQGLSRGERKRLTIGVELVANPGVLFLDEPTTALSSTQARDVARGIRMVASSGRSVICTLHQPSQGVWANMDNLLLLARGGYTVYFGEVGASSATMVRYLSALPGAPELPDGMNPADYMLDVIGSEGKDDAKAAHSDGAGAAAATAAAAGSGGGAEALASASSHKHASAKISASPSGRAMSRGEQLLQSFLGSTAKAGLDETLNGMGAAKDTHTTRIGQKEVESTAHGEVTRLNFFSQLILLTVRQTLDFARDAEFGLKRCIIFLVLALIAGGVFFNLGREDTDQAGVLSLVGGVLMSIIFVGAIAANTTAVAMQKRRPSYVREQAALTYNPSAYAFAMLFAALPWNFLFVVIFTLVYAGMVGYDFSLVPFMMLIVLLFTNSMSLIAMGLGFIAETPQLVTVLISLVMSLSAMFGGFFVPRADIPPGWIWLHYLAPMTFHLEAAVPAAFYCADTSNLVAGGAGPCATIDAFDGGQLLRGIPKLDFIERFYGYDIDGQSLAVGICFVYGTAMFALFNVALWRLRAKAV